MTRDPSSTQAATALEKPQRSAPGSAATTVLTPADALRVEEVQRTRQFIVVSWFLNFAAIAIVPLLPAPRAMSITFVTALLLGSAYSAYLYRRFADPRRYAERHLFALATIAIVNTHVAVLYFGVFTPAAVMMVIGLHFGARNEDARVARALFAVNIACYLAVASIVVAGVIDDPGVFASDRPLARTTLAAGAIFVIGVYALAFYSGRALRETSLGSIEALQHATRLAAQRRALLDELRLDLERALQVGGPGRHTDRVLGTYRLGVVRGRGAVGEVYDAVHVVTGEPAAVKVLRPDLASDAAHLERFLREARASAAIESPHVVRVLEASADDAALPFLAMERLQGETLAEQLRRDGRLAPADVVALCREVGAGIDAACAAGVVHRDLKPQNLFRTEAPVTWKILDFGVAALIESSGTLTAEGVVGTPSYMAPEQAQGQRVDGRADTYALGAVAYRCLTGRQPFGGPDTPAVLYAVVHKMPRRPSALAALDPDVDRWAAIALAKAPDDRFATGAALADALVRALAGGLDAKQRRHADALLRAHAWEAA